MIPIRYNIRSLAIRKTTTLVTAFGIALVVFVLATALMLAEGIRRAMNASGEPEVAVVLRKGSDAELSSSIDAPHVGLVLAAPGVAQNHGSAQGVGEVVVVAALDKIGGEGVSNVNLRGVPDNVFRFRKNARIVAGRLAKAGTDEVIVGKKIRGRFKGLELGQAFEIRKNRRAPVVGIFEDNGASTESEVWGDIDSVRTSFGREGLVSSVRVRLTSPAKFDGFRAAVEQDKRLGLMALQDQEFLEKQSEGVSIFVTALGSIIAFFFSIGAMIGAMITMYGAVAGRIREVGTLRALGFSRRAILSSFLLESLFLAGIGGLIGCLASLGMGFVTFSMMNFATWSEIFFTFTPTPQILLTALIAAGGMGLLGGLLPAIRAARVSPVNAMRA